MQTDFKSIFVFSNLFFGLICDGSAWPERQHCVLSYNNFELIGLQDFFNALQMLSMHKSNANELTIVQKQNQ